MKQKISLEKPEDYFRKSIELTGTFVSESNRLTNRELNFLVECCLYNYNGGDLTVHRKLSQHFLDINFFSREKDVAVYKYKISNKGWVKTGRNIFILPNYLDKKPGDKMNIVLELNVNG